MATQPYHSQAPRQGGFHRIADQMGDAMLTYWAHGVTVILGLLVFAAISVPFLSYFGLDALSKPIFFTLHYVCAQIPSHSFYIFGHQLGMCARNFSIYASMFVGSLIFVLSKKRIPGIPWWLWGLMILPIAFDGITQMFGLRESDWVLRLLTGTLFGLGNVWFALPLMQKSLLESAQQTIPHYYRPQSYPATYTPAPVYQPVPAISPIQTEQTAAKTDHAE
ncbi:DUF2085 domain-containing protein [Tengunoibacter tsumagoiensis]|nr:DUF2085 domain-containing protein [Tengunoibacter tsumagoiensis]